MTTSLWQTHNKQVALLSEQLKGAAAAGKTVVRGRDPSEVSHVTRGRVPGKKPISFRALNSVLEVYHTAAYAWVEPGVTMDALATACLTEHLIPSVLPECKGITVGGAIMGAGLESGSFAHGQFNDICFEYEVLLADGTLKRISPQADADLFYGLAGSYGTLAHLTAVKIALEPSRDYVRLDYIVTKHAEDFITQLERLCLERPDYLDAMALADGRIVIMRGNRIDRHQAPEGVRLLPQNHWWATWFAQHVLSKVEKVAPDADYLTVYDYQFRYDRGGFWMGQFVTSPGALLRHLSRWHLSQPNLAQHLHEIYRKDPPTLNPSLMWRALMGWKLSTRSLYRVFHHLPEVTRANLYLVQDFYIPTQRVAEFLHYLRRKVGIYPLWLCPIRGMNQGQFFCPHHLSDPSRFPQPDFVNVGVYGIPAGDRPVPQVVQELEQYANDLGGRKVLYSFNFYSEETFWNVYPQDRYNDLRTRYGAEGRLVDFYQKLNTPEYVKR